MASIGTLAIQLSANTGLFEQRMRGAAARVNKFTAGVMASAGKLKGYGGMLTGAILGGGAIYAIKRSIDTIGELTDTADNLGIASDKLVALRKAAEDYGAGAGELDRALIRLRRSSAEAAGGDKELSKTFKRLGVDATALAKLPLQEQFYVMADAMSMVGNSSERTAMAFDLFGRGSMNLLMLMESGSGTIRDYEGLTRRLGTAVNNIEAKRVDAMDEAMKRVKDTITGVINKMLVEWAPAITQVSNAYTEMATAATEGNNSASASATKAAENALSLQQVLYVLEGGWRTFAVAAGTLGGVFAGTFQAGVDGAQWFGRMALTAFTHVTNGVRVLADGFQQAWAIITGGVYEFKSLDDLIKDPEIPEWLQKGEDPQWIKDLGKANKQLRDDWLEWAGRREPSARTNNWGTAVIDAEQAAADAAKNRENAEGGITDQYKVQASLLEKMAGQRSEFFDRGQAIVNPSSVAAFNFLRTPEYKEGKQQVKEENSDAILSGINRLNSNAGLA